MLRGLVLLFLLLNAALWFWIRSDPQALRADRDPGRVGGQLHPETIQVLPDLPRTGGAPPPSPTSLRSPDPADDAAGGARRAGSAASQAATIACAESGPLDAAQWATLTRTLADAGLPATAIGERREVQPGRWIVYMGRYGDEEQWQHKAGELRRMNLKFERVSAPPGLDPGLSLGSFSSPEAAAARLQELGHHGVHTARVVNTAASSALRHLQVRAEDDVWRSAVGGQRFGPCSPPASV